MTEELQGRAARVHAEHLAQTRPLTQVELDAQAAGRPLTSAELKVVAASAELHQERSKEELHHIENALKIKQREKTLEEREAEARAAAQAPGVAQREAERQAALKALASANEALGLQGLPLAAQPKDETPDAVRKPYTVIKDIHTTIAGRHIMAKEGSQVQLSDQELLGVHGHVKG